MQNKEIVKTVIIANISALLALSILLNIILYQQVANTKKQINEMSLNVDAVDKEKVEINKTIIKLEDQIDLIEQSEQATLDKQESLEVEITQEEVVKDAEDYEEYAGIKLNEDGTYTIPDEAIEAFLKTEQFSDLTAEQMKIVLIDGGLAGYIVSLQLDGATIKSTMYLLLVDLTELTSTFRAALPENTEIAQNSQNSGSNSTSTSEVTSPEVEEVGDSSFVSDLTNTGAQEDIPEFNLQ